MYTAEFQIQVNYKAVPRTHVSRSASRIALFYCQFCGHETSVEWKLLFLIYLLIHLIISIRCMPNIETFIWCIDFKVVKMHGAEEAAPWLRALVPVEDLGWVCSTHIGEGLQISISFSYRESDAVFWILKTVDTARMWCTCIQSGKTLYTYTRNNFKKVIKMQSRQKRKEWGESKGVTESTILSNKLTNE